MEIFGIATVAFMIAGFVKGVVGFGFPIIALIILTLSIGLLDALALVVIPTLITNLWQAFSGNFRADVAVFSGRRRIHLDYVRLSRCSRR